LVEHSLGKGEVTSSILVIGSRDIGGAVTGGWLVVKWIVLVFCGLYFVLICVALVRLEGRLEKKAIKASWLVLTSICLSDLAQDFFATRVAIRAGWMVVGAAATIAMVVVIRLLVRDAQGLAES
jgi:hypothetical protein